MFITIKNNEPYTGRIFSTYDNGKIKLEGLLKNGIKHGDFIYWHENGKKSGFGHFNNGKKWELDLLDL